MASSSSLLSASPFPVFIDSTLETHLVMLVSSRDTVASLKRMIEMKHAVAFPDIGDIIVKAVKVKRKGSLYHMSDSMLVNGAFLGVKGTMFLQIEAVAAPRSERQISTEQNVEKQNLKKLEGKNSEDNFVLDKLQPSSELGALVVNNFSAQVTLNHSVPVENLRTEKDGSSPPGSDALAKTEAQITSRTSLNKDSKEINTATTHVMSPPEKKKNRKTKASSEDAALRGSHSMNEKDGGLVDNSVHEKQMLSENPGDTNKQTNESIIPLNQTNTDSIINHGDAANQSANQVANNVETMKGKSRKVLAEKKNSMDGNLGEKRRRKEMVPDKNLVTNNTNLIISSSTEANGTETIKPDANIQSNQDGGAGTGTSTETKKVKSRKGVSKKGQVTLTPEKKKAKKAKVSSETPPVRETGFNAGEDNPALERDSVMPQNPGDTTFLAPKEVLLNEINTDKPRSDKTVSTKGKKEKSLAENVNRKEVSEEIPKHASPYKTRSKKSKAATADVAAAQDETSVREHESCNDLDINPGLEKEISANDAGQIISSILTDLKEQGPLAPEHEANEMESQTLANADEAINQANADHDHEPEPEPLAETSKTKSKSKISSIEKNEISQNTASSFNGDPVIGCDENKKCKKAKAFSLPLLRGNESENTSKFETHVVAASSQQENERNQDHMGPNLVEDPSKQDKKNKRRKHEVKSTVEKGSDEMVNNTLKGSDEIVIQSSETDPLKPPKRKSSRAKSKEKSVNSSKGNIGTTDNISGENNKNASAAETEANRSTVVHNLDAGKINFIDYFGPGTTNQPSDKLKESKEAKKRLKGPNPSSSDMEVLVNDMAYLSESTEDENDAQNEAKRYKVAVRKVPVKRTGEKNRKNSAVAASGLAFNDNASESTRDEGGSLVSDGTAKMKKGIASPGSGGTEKRESVDGVAPPHQSSRPSKKKLFSDEKANTRAEDSQHVDIVYETEEQDLAF